MIGKITSCLPLGFDGRLITIEADSSNALPGLTIVGMANKTIDEAKERVRSALKNSNFEIPKKRIIINLAPTDLHKDGAYLDLPIALAIMLLAGQLKSTDVEDALFVGELSLDGTLRPVKGIINIVEAAVTAGIKKVFIPVDNYTQAILVPGIEIIPIPSLKSLFFHLKEMEKIEPTTVHVKNTKTDKKPENQVFLDHIRGQIKAKRALTIAIAGRHNILISGPPGAGKTLLARAAHELLPNPTPLEQIAITKLHSLTSASSDIATSRPFRSPHHTSSLNSIIGGGPSSFPGEISLAHLGVLFLDELPEYPRSVLESLRQPLEDKIISVSRTRLKAVYPADFMLVATMNPCPCGFYGDPVHECSCTATQIDSYRKKLSGPLLDRIDLSLSVSKVDTRDLLAPLPDTSHEHATAKDLILSASKLQRKRYQTSNFYNTNLSSPDISRLPVTLDAKALLEKAGETMRLSARSHFKILKIAQTITDLEQSSKSSPNPTAPIDTPAVAEALSYR